MRVMNVAMFLAASGSLFAIMNPFAALPVFLSLTGDATARNQHRAAIKVGIYCAIASILVLLTGSLLLQVFGVNIDGFRVAGGIVLCTIGLGMLHGGSQIHDGNAAEQEHQATQAVRGDFAFYPLTFPILVGPGTITTLVLLAGHAHSAADWFAVVAALAVIIALLASVLFCAGNIGKHMSQTMRTIMTRLMGMILTAIGVQMIVAGLKALLPGLA